MLNAWSITVLRAIAAMPLILCDAAKIYELTAIGAAATFASRSRR
jgi:hypothetical protein